jgi:threonyl-tRNA synthetase
MNQEQLQKIRHSICHLMSMAMQEIYPSVGLGVGPFIEDGFYQDYDLPESISEEIFPKLEKRIKEMIKEKIDFVQHQVSFDEALAQYKHDPYKTEMIVDLQKAGEKSVWFYKSGWFENLCKGPHVKNTNEIDPKAFKLTKVAGAYWRGCEKNKMLTRIYGVAFENKEKLDEYLRLQEEAEKRDHRKLGKELDLFSLHEEGPGFPFWHPNGMVLYERLENFIRQENKKRGYNEVKTPIILNKDLWVTSGHWEKFQESMYFTKIDELDYAVKPMNCPGGLLIYKDSPHSYRELPIRNAEFGLVHRHEKSGVLHGLFRVRAFTQDDAHSFCTQEQLNDEIINMVEFAVDVYSTFGFTEYTIYIATRPEKYIGSDQDWESATMALKNALEQKGLDYKIKEGEGAFYGPKIEFNIKDSIGRDWQCGTIQVDYSMPNRFGAVYNDNNNQEKTPVMVHRAILGSLERFLGILIEHYAGAFPVWLSPIQIQLVPVSVKHVEGAKKLAQDLYLDYKLRIEVDEANETVGNKVRKAVQTKVPYVIVIGDRELEGGELTIRVRGQEEQLKISKDKFIENIINTIKNKK